MGNKSLTKLKILNASIEEFAAKGYENASTNAIASAAGVSKGAIFLHYKNKEGLFEACLTKVMDNYKKQVQTLDISTIKDLFDRIEVFLKWKVQSYSTDPLSAQFLTTCYLLKDEPLKARLIQSINAFALPIKKLVLDFDFMPEHYVEGMSKEKILTILGIIMAGFEHIYSNAFETLPNSKIFEEWKDIIQAVKHGIMRKQ